MKRMPGHDEQLPSTQLLGLTATTVLVFEKLTDYFPWTPRAHAQCPRPRPTFMFLFQAWARLFYLLINCSSSKWVTSSPIDKELAFITTWVN